jgi:hypothetical protein
MKTNLLLLRFAVLLAATTTPFIAPAASEPSAKTEPATGLTPEQKVAVEALDAELVRFEGRVQQITDAGYQAEMRATLGKFKQRRDAFRAAAFDQNKYDELRFEINVEYQRMMIWLRPLPTPPSAKNAK